MEATATYSCEQTLLYMVSRTLWQNAKLNIADLKNFKGFYTATYCDDQIANIDLAEELETNEARQRKHADLRLKVVKDARECCDLYQSLKLYIVSAYPNAEERENSLRAAGQGYYASAAAENWVDMQTLLDMSSKFIADNAVELKAGNNMSNDFGTTYNTAKTRYETTYTLFDTAVKTAHAGQQAKIVANNVVDAAQAALCGDGQHVFRDNDLLKSDFSFNAISERMSPTGAARIEFTVTDAANGKGLIVDIQLVGTTRKTSTDKFGNGLMGLLGAEEYTFALSADGYQPQTLKYTFKTGQTLRSEIERVKLFATVGGEVSEAPVSDEAVVVEK